MSDEQDMVVHVIVSTGSGTGEAKAFWENELQSRMGPEHYSLHTTDSDIAILKLVESTIGPATLITPQYVFLLSGDGGVVDLVNGLLAQARSPQTGEHYHRPRLILFPLGTGNALAQSAGITREKALDLFTHGVPDPIPVFQVTFSHNAKLLVDEGREEREIPLVNGTPTVYGVVVCSWGLHAGLVADSDTAEYRKLGAERFKLAAKENLFPSDGSEAHHYMGTVRILRAGETDWVEVPRTEHAYVLATTCSHLEQGFNISPASRPLDGKLRLVHFGALGGKDVMEIMGAAYQGGKHVDDPRVGYEEIDGLRIEFAEEDARWRRVCVDGKIIRVEKGGWVEVKMGPKAVLNLVH
ncbi:hypothetical protein B0A48_04136 [Cryoendolithus antarcticus]|uniref:DAGKc domain-containing protein n=1 Tax=Cryoendolithus antarcticus TaxID=1507870 RepID=A0A1V8THI5_9PEZI|nr:hypothetical protein B0A48_04136 [Cryoendolithus antarcticus]